jgi:predicted DNA-binding transcriptional regulator YafY
VRALQGAIATLDGGRVEVDADALLVLARGCRDRLRVEFGYADRTGSASVRRAEPYRLVATGRRWYLVAYDLDRADWRTFRLDRLHDARATTFRYRPRDHPDPVALVQRSISVAPYPHRVRILLHADAATVRGRVPATVAVVEPAEEGRCVLSAGGADPAFVLLHVALLGFAFEVLEPEEVRGLAAELGRRLVAAGAVAESSA